jgi:hypothetical protein
MYHQHGDIRWETTMTDSTTRGLTTRTEFDTIPDDRLAEQATDTTAELESGVSSREYRLLDSKQRAIATEQQRRADSNIAIVDLPDATSQRGDAWVADGKSVDLSQPTDDVELTIVLAEDVLGGAWMLVPLHTVDRLVGMLLAAKAAAPAVAARDAKAGA